jgi:hypothetical protein
VPTKMFKCNLGACMQNTMAVQSAPATRVQHDAKEGGCIFFSHGDKLNESHASTLQPRSSLGRHPHAQQPCAIPRPT